MSFLTLTDVSKSFGDLQAVADVNLSVEKGEFVSLLGPSGCGKTTTLQMIAGFVEATRGRITLDGRDITHVKPEQARPRHRVPELRAVSAHDRRARTSASAWRCARSTRPSATSACAKRWRSCGSTRSRTAFRASCPAASGSAWRSRARS